MALPQTQQAALEDRLAELRARVRGTNINEKTLLATDYLNHFNEFVMLLDLIPAMPDCLAEAEAWRPKGYKEHFRDSAFSSRDLAIEAYDDSPAEYRGQFDSTVAMIDGLVPKVLDRIREAAASGEAGRLAHECATTSQLLQGLMDCASAIVNGENPTIDQGGVDALLNG
jgi:hypothetical protein